METEINSDSYQLDHIDKQILALLEEDGKRNSKEIATEIGLTITPTYERIRRLEKKGFITGYKAKISKEKTGKQLRAFCNISLKTHSVEFLSAFEEAVVKLKQVTATYHIAGNYDYLLLIEVKDMNEYSYFLKEKLAGIPHIATVQSSFILKTMKED